MPSGRGRGRAGGNGGYRPTFDDNDEAHHNENANDGEDGSDAEYDDSDEELEDELAQQVALPVSGGPLPPSDEPPQDADEYLRRVQWERMHLSETVDVEVAEKPSRKKQQDTRCSLMTRFDAPEVPDHLRHSSEWGEDAVEAFRALRRRCDDLRQSMQPESGDEATADRMCFSDDTWREQFANGQPTTSMLSMQDVVTLHRLLVIVIDAVVDAQTAADEAQSSSAGPFGPDSFLAQWVFAVLAFVDEPLVDDIQYNLQRLRRTCQKAIAAAHSRADSGTETFDQTSHAKASLVLAVVREYFRQC